MYEKNANEMIYINNSLNIEWSVTYGSLTVVGILIECVLCQKVIDFFFHIKDEMLIIFKYKVSFSFKIWENKYIFLNSILQLL